MFLQYPKKALKLLELSELVQELKNSLNNLSMKIQRYDKCRNLKSNADLQELKHLKTRKQNLEFSITQLSKILDEEQ